MNRLYIIIFTILLSTLSAFSQSGEAASDEPLSISTDQLSVLLNGMFNRQINSIDYVLKDYLEQATQGQFKVDYKYSGRLIGKIYFYDAITGKLRNLIEFKYGEIEGLRNVPVALVVNNKLISFKDNWSRILNRVSKSGLFSSIQGSLEFDMEQSGKVKGQDYGRFAAELNALVEPEMNEIKTRITQEISESFDSELNPSDIRAQKIKTAQRQQFRAKLKEKSTLYLMNFLAGVMVTNGVADVLFSVQSPHLSLARVTLAIVHVAVAIYNFLPLFSLRDTVLHSMFRNWFNRVHLSLSHQKQIDAIRSIGKHKGPISDVQKIGPVLIRAVESEIANQSADAVIITNFSNTQFQRTDLPQKVYAAGGQSTQKHFEDMVTGPNPTLVTGDAVLIDSIGGIAKIHAQLAAWSSPMANEFSYSSNSYRDSEIENYTKALKKSILLLAARSDVKTVLLPIVNASSVDRVTITQITFKVLEELRPILEKSKIRQVIVVGERDYEIESIRAAIRTHFYDGKNEAIDLKTGFGTANSCFMLFN